MKVNEESVKRIQKNAEVAKGIYEELCRDANFKERFHLRPDVME